MRKDNSELNKERLRNRLWRSALRVSMLFMVLVGIYCVILSIVALKTTFRPG